MARALKLTVGEWYHCFNRGIDRRKTFASESDYDRFVMHLYAGLFKRPLHVSNLSRPSLSGLVDLASKYKAQDERLVEIGAYCLMPSSVHLIVRESVEGGLSTFMQRVFTG